MVEIGVTSTQSKEKSPDTKSSAMATTSTQDLNLEEDKEGCSNEEDLEKKIMEEAKKKPEEAFKLQGGDTGCSTH